MDSKQENQESREMSLIRILATDIPGKMFVYAGLTKIKGVSWSFSNAICKILKISRNKKIADLSEQEIKNITDLIKNPSIPEHLLNRRKDLETGENLHLTGSNLELRKEFDIKRLKKIRSYKGFRHATGRPVRGQRTRGNFRKTKKAMGVKKKRK